MPAYSITYDLNKSDKNYQGLIEEIKKSTLYINYQKSAWLVKSDESVRNLNDRIRNRLDDNDYLLIIEVKDNYMGWLPTDDWDFIDQHIFN